MFYVWLLITQSRTWIRDSDNGKVSLSCFAENDTHMWQQVQLPKAESSAGADDSEEVSYFWLVDDIFTFENISFSQTVSNRKFLACADCEYGPIGFHDIETKLSYLSVDRVKTRTTWSRHIPTTRMLFIRSIILRIFLYICKTVSTTWRRIKHLITLTPLWCESGRSNLFDESQLLFYLLLNIDCAANSDCNQWSVSQEH